MRRVLKAAALVGLGVILGAVSTGVFAYRSAEKSARDGIYTEKLLSVVGSSQLLELLDAEKLSAARKVLEHELAASLQSAEELAAEGATIPFYPAFLGEFQAGLARTQNYAAAHGLDPAVTQRAQHLQAVLKAGS